MKIFDSHVHFVDPSRREGVTWPEPDSPLYRPTYPVHLEDAMKPHVLDGCIAVETSRRYLDDEWLANLAAREDLVRGFVENLQPDQPEFIDRLRSLSSKSKFVGIRLRPIEAYDLSSDNLGVSFEVLARHGKSVEFGAKNECLKQQFARLAREFSCTTWILNHCGHPESSTVDAEWRSGLAEIASEPNTVVKVSGLSGSLGQWRATLEILVDLFGNDRLLYGSNWPVCTLVDGDSTKIEEFIGFLGEDAEKFFCSNAMRAYGIAG